MHAAFEAEAAEAQAEKPSTLDTGMLSWLKGPTSSKMLASSQVGLRSAGASLKVSGNGPGSFKVEARCRRDEWEPRVVGAGMLGSGKSLKMEIDIFAGRRTDSVLDDQSTARRSAAMLSDSTFPAHAEGDAKELVGGRRAGALPTIPGSCASSFEMGSFSRVFSGRASRASCPAGSHAIDVDAIGGFEDRPRLETIMSDVSLRSQERSPDLRATASSERLESGSSSPPGARSPRWPVPEGAELSVEEAAAAVVGHASVV
jgi:hypothetical protein